MVTVVVLLLVGLPHHSHPSIPARLFRAVALDTSTATRTAQRRFILEPIYRCRRAPINNNFHPPLLQHLFCCTHFSLRVHRSSTMAYIPYQVDHSVQNTAKTLGFSKKRVTFKFGFASPQALDQGLTGAQCRGSEHEVTFLWSLKSGKRQLFLDGKDVHYSESGQNGWTADRAWQYSFPLRDNLGGRTYKVHFISQPVNKDISPDMKPFDLRVNGVSYFSFNEIWKLGTPAMISRDGGPRSYGSGGGYNDAHLSAEERRQIAIAKAESLKDFERKRARSSQGGSQKPMVHKEEALISFDDPPPPPQVASIVSASTGPGQPPPNAYSQYASSLTLDPAIADGGRAVSGNSYGQLPPPPNPYGAPAPAPPVPGYAPYGAPAPVPTNSSAMTPYTAGPAPSPYAMPPQPPAPVQTYGYGSNTAPPPAGFNAMASPSAQSYASYGSAPSFARPPQASSPYGDSQASYGYPGQAQPGAPGNYAAPPPQQQQQQQQQPYPSQPYPQPPYGYPNQPSY